MQTASPSLPLQVNTPLTPLIILSYLCSALQGADPTVQPCWYLSQSLDDTDGWLTGPAGTVVQTQRERESCPPCMSSAPLQVLNIGHTLTSYNYTHLQTPHTSTFAHIPVLCICMHVHTHSHKHMTTHTTQTHSQFFT